MVLIGWPVIGMILEAYGFIVLFRFFSFSHLPIARAYASISLFQ